MATGSEVDFLVMGAGVAGLRAAVELAQHGDVLVVTKESLGESNTHYAQGGIAVAMEGSEDVALHLEDTVNAGDGIVYRPAAEALVSEGPARVAELIEWGANFDREAGQLLRTRDELGYVITDIGTEYSEEVLAELRSMDVTIRLRTIAE